MSQHPGRQQITIEQILRRPVHAADVPRTFRMLAPELPRPLRSALLLLLLPAVEVACQLVVAIAGKLALDGVTAATPRIDVRPLLVAAAGVCAFFVVARVRLVTQETVALAWRRRCVERLSRSIAAGSLEDLAAVPMAELREIVMTDAPFATRFFVDLAGQSVVLAFWMCAAVLVFGYLSAPLLALLGVLLALFGGALGLGLLRHLRLTGERFRRLAALSERARDVAEVERVMLARQFGLGDRFVRLMMKAHDGYGEALQRQAALAATVRASLLALNALAFLGVVAVGGALVARSGLDAAALAPVLFVIGQMLAALAQLGDLAGRSAEAAAAGKRIGAYWSAPDARAEAIPRLAGGRLARLETRDLWFAYGEGAPVLRGVNVALERGKMVALTAATGSGKSTLALLLAGLLEPTEGMVAVNGDSGWPVRDLPPGKVLYVGPRPVLLAGSVRDNLFGGNADSPLVQPIWAELLRGGQFDLDDEGAVTPGGTGLSSGQGQLVQLARAVLKQPDVIILDEATGSLDMATEQKIQSHLLDWCRDRICFVISHRPCPWLSAADAHISW